MLIARTSRSAASRTSTSSSVTVSVTATTRPFAELRLVGIEAAERNAAEDAPVDHCVHRRPRFDRQLQREFVEEAVVDQADTRDSRQPVRRFARARVIQFGKPVRPFSPSRVMWTEKASAQSPELVQILRGRFLAPDMLLAGRERQHEAALALGIDGLAGEAARASGGHISRVWRTGRHRARRTAGRRRSTGLRRRRCPRPSRPAT